MYTIHYNADAVRTYCTTYEYNFNEHVIYCPSQQMLPNCKITYCDLTVNCNSCFLQPSLEVKFKIKIIKKKKNRILYFSLLFISIYY